MITPSDVDTAERSMWRYRAALPELAGAAPVSLGEGCTPLVARDWAGACPRFKLEWFSPSGSFKDRGASALVTALRAAGATAIVEDSSGNGGAAVATYGAAAGLAVTVFAPASTSPAKLVQARAAGAAIELVDGPREASEAAALAAVARGDAHDAGHNRQAVFLQGTKTLAYELWEDLGFRAPDAIVLPVGAGSSLLGCAFGFGELLEAGAIDRLPRLYAAQPLHCSPIDAAFAEPGAERPVLPTIAEGTAIRAPGRLAEILVAIRRSDGGTVAVTEDEIRAAHVGLARTGLYAEPTSAVAAAGLTRLLARGEIRAEETTVVVLTGSGLKSPLAG
ncbi:MULTISPECIES: threonine synthase [unclassified Leucobacter]|uniref:threonine synthase n=1 Tax=unclassified Leucobacter TaxID=2621730 RepID=UPI00069A8E1D|nr:pyridoxal-phosphate dependent enzyme [Leucobacter sp. Ag1]